MVHQINFKRDLFKYPKLLFEQIPFEMNGASDKFQKGSVQITVWDNGTGIPPHIKEHIFNPFFTTKPSGEGTGLGLSISHDIILVHGGTMTVESVENEFTEFRITLPVISNSDSEFAVEADAENG